VHPRAAAQVGILTKENPLGMFHVDPRSDTRIENGDTLGLADDAVVTFGGNLTIGDLPQPAADTLSLRLTDGGTPSVPRSPLRIVDGNQQEGQVLTSYDTDGNAYWDLPTDFTSGRVYGLQNIAAASFPLGSYIDIFTFTPDATGSYFFEIRWWGKFKGQVAIPFMIFQLFRGSSSTLMDSFEYYSGANPDDLNNVCSLCFTLYAKAVNTTDVFKINVVTSAQNQTGNRKDGAGQDTSVTPEWTRTKVNVLRID
jgi:hypothetical protein